MPENIRPKKEKIELYYHSFPRIFKNQSKERVPVTFPLWVPVTFWPKVTGTHTGTHKKPGTFHGKYPAGVVLYITL